MAKCSIVNHQKCLIWWSENLHLVHEKLLNLQICSLVWARTFSKTEVAALLLAMVYKFTILEYTFYSIKCHFNKNQIVFSQKGDIDWLPRTCYLTPLDFLCCYLKSWICVNKSTTIPNLKENSWRKIAEIEPQALWKTSLNRLYQISEVLENIWLILFLYNKIKIFQYSVFYSENKLDFIFHLDHSLQLCYLIKLQMAQSRCNELNHFKEEKALKLNARNKTVKNTFSSVMINSFSLFDNIFS